MDNLREKREKREKEEAKAMYLYELLYWGIAIFYIIVVGLLFITPILWPSSQKLFVIGALMAVFTKPIFTFVSDVLGKIVFRKK